MMKKILKIQALGVLLVSTSVLANPQSSCDNYTTPEKSNNIF